MARPAPLVKIKALDNRVSWDSGYSHICKGEIYSGEKIRYQGLSGWLDRWVIKGKPYLVHNETLDIGWATTIFQEI